MFRRCCSHIPAETFYVYTVDISDGYLFICLRTDDFHIMNGYICMYITLQAYASL